MASHAPQVNKTDPTSIPSVGCTSVQNLTLTLNKTSSAHFSTADYDGSDAMLFAAFTNSESENSQGYNMTEQMQAFDKEMCNGSVQKFVQKQKYQPAMGKCKMFHVTSSPSLLALGFAGMGSSSSCNTADAQTFAKGVANMISASQCEKVQMVFPDELQDQQFFKNFVTALYIATSPHILYLSNNASKNTFTNFKSMNFVMNTSFQSTFEKMMKEAQAFACGMYTAAELVNAPPNYCNTVTLANYAAEVASAAGMQFKVLEEEECAKLGMGAYLGVAKGSFYPPKFITMNYSSGTAAKKVFFVGKGVVFDSGGYNLKPASGMIDLMKFDMGASAALFGTAQAIGMMKPDNCDITFVVPAAENMISSKAYRPGDVLTASNGKTIEIGNTDAEGRLCLADALVYAENNGADVIIDAATLTGACMVALGLKFAALYSSDDELGKNLKKCADFNGELMWPMPLAKIYMENFSSKIADMNNTAKSPQGGSIIAALFLSNFVNKAKWAHIDMPAPVFDFEAGTGTGFGVKTLTQYVLNCSQGTM